MLDIPTCKFFTNIEELLKYRTSLLKGCYDAPKPSIRPAIKTIYDLHSDVKKKLHIIAYYYTPPDQGGPKHCKQL